MIRAVIFDMYETLITHYKSPLCFSMQLAEAAGIPLERFQALWFPTDVARSTGRLTLEAALADILSRCGVDADTRLRALVEKRSAIKRDCFLHLHEEILPMLDGLRTRGLRIGLVSNCYSEEAAAIRESDLFPRFDAAMLSWEQGIQKPDPEIFLRCTQALGVAPQECLYVGDGGSHELEAAQALGMQAGQATWYFQQGVTPMQVNDAFPELRSPLDVLAWIDTQNIEIRFSDKNEP